MAEREGRLVIRAAIALWHRVVSNLGLADDGVAGADDPWWLEPYPDSLLEPVQLGGSARYDARESITLPFVTGLQRLPAPQRTVLLLRDVLGFTTAEAADILGTTTFTVNSELARARKCFRPDPRPNDIAAPRSSAETAVVDRFVGAFQSGDVRSVLQILSVDARLSTPPTPIQCSGPRAVAAHLRSRGFWGPELSLIATRANGQPAFGYYLPVPDDGCSRLQGLIVLTVTDGQISTITRFGADVVRHFGLPQRCDQPGLPG